MDDFGILPFEIPTCGFLGFSLDPIRHIIYPDRIEAIRRGKSFSIPFELISGIERAGNEVIVFSPNLPQGRHAIYYKSNSNGLANLLKILVQENRDWQQLKAAKPLPENFSEELNRILSWRGQPFVHAAEFLL